MKGVITSGHMKGRVATILGDNKGTLEAIVPGGWPSRQLDSKYGIVNGEYWLLLKSHVKIIECIMRQ